MARSHGSGQACYKARAEIKCDECWQYWTSAHRFASRKYMATGKGILSKVRANARDRESRRERGLAR